MRRNKIIEELENEQLKDVDTNFSPGDTVVLTILRDGDVFETTVTLGVR